MHNFDSEKLKSWFIQEQRPLPWRENSTPYAVWVSEVMLQQTQVLVVIPYFERWISRYPTIQSLAEASLDDVIKSWEGLGYYSRARNLHEGARYVLEHHQGILPNTWEALSKIKGLGNYTIGAILSFAFHQRVPAVDGNVMRVLSRYFCIEDDLCKPKNQKMLRNLTAEILPLKDPWIISEALIELGAVICIKKPKCFLCPLKSSCRAFAEGSVDRFPIKSQKVKIEKLYRVVPILIHEESILIRKVEKGKIMSDLHEFPYFETTLKGMTAPQIKNEVLKNFGIQAGNLQKQNLVKQSFTRYQVELFPWKIACKEKVHTDGYQWVSLTKARELPFSSGHRRILFSLFKIKGFFGPDGLEL